MRHVAERIFDQLALAILRGDLPAAAPLPSERLLGERFGCSRIIVRQAVHRLAELGLVRVKQGEASCVLDPAAATDLRVLALFYRLAPDDATLGPSAADMIEKQYLQGLSMVSVAARRAPSEALRRLRRLVEAYATGEHRQVPVSQFEEQFWRGLARAGGNRIFVMETEWWYQVLRERPVPAAVRATPRARRLLFYLELMRRLVERDRPVEWYVEVVGPILDGLFR